MCILSNFMDGTKLRGVIDTPYAMLYHVHTSGCASTGWRKESTRISWNSIKSNAKSCIWAGIVPCACINWGWTRDPHREWPDGHFTGHHCAPLWKRKKEKRNLSWASLSRVSSADRRWDPSPLLITGETHLKLVQLRAMTVSNKLKHLSQDYRLKGHSFQLWKLRFRQNLYAY